MVILVVDDKNLVFVEIWLDKFGIKFYDLVVEMIVDYKKFSEIGEKINVVYVYDKVIGLKLFSYVVFYVEYLFGELVFYMKKGEVEKVKGKGVLISWFEVVKIEKVVMVEQVVWRFVL